MSNKRKLRPSEVKGFGAQQRARKRALQVANTVGRARNAAIKASIPELEIKIGTRIHEQLEKAEPGIKWAMFFSRHANGFRQHAFRLGDDQTWSPMSLCGKAEYIGRTQRSIPSETPRCSNCEKSLAKLRRTWAKS